MSEQWITLEGAEGLPGNGKHVVLVSGDEEYRSEEALPMLGKVLATHHGFKCTVLFAINPDTGEIDPCTLDNIPGLKALEDADCMIIATRFRELPDEQMKYIIDFINAGKPVIGLRTATHAFRYKNNPDSPYAKYDCGHEEFKGGFGRQILGETWVMHWGNHKHESSRGVINPDAADHPILRGVTDVWGPSDVYEVGKLTGTPTVLLNGQVLTGMQPDDPANTEKALMPMAWIKEYVGDTGNSSKVFCTTMGGATDFPCADLRRLIVNAVYWCVGQEDGIDAASCVDIVGEYNPTHFAYGEFKQGLFPQDYA